MTAIQAVPSLAKGDALTADTWSDFVARLRHDTVGERRHDHCTADAIFLVQMEEKIYGLDKEYADEDNLVIFCDDWKWFSVADYWNDADDHQKAKLNRMSQDEHGCKFRRADPRDQWVLLGELPEHRLLAYQTQWTTVNTHLTHAAAEAFIKRKQHDYPPLRVYADSAYWAWELKTIREAILNGSLAFVGATADKAA
ncbi:hypothetical protein [Pseudomonas sp. PNPG3]|uniref:hypothetical protein n=1 Tax=Pseudomonas sp. PNPG3 TaxID=2919497 RepID=UPI001FFD70E1|nr:hypothetical protein [Pseudomonas sp. PNPG3]MCK2122068.1 hypothetical protein [Pseudomonas sp. PNPG3]